MQVEIYARRVKKKRALCSQQQQAVRSTRSRYSHIYFCVNFKKKKKEREEEKEKSDLHEILCQVCLYVRVTHGASTEKKFIFEVQLFPNSDSLETFMYSHVS